jgi:hypothetical protein
VCPERLPGVVVPHGAAGEELVHASREVVRPFADHAGVRQPAEREHGMVARGDHIHVVARPPHLRERAVLQRRRGDPFHPRVDREERGPRHAVLDPGPSRLPERTLTRRGSPIERTDAPPEREDLRSRELQRRRHPPDRKRHCAGHAACGPLGPEGSKSPPVASSAVARLLSAVRVRALTTRGGMRSRTAISV